MLKEQKNSKKQGDVGIGLAIGYFASKGITVCVPLTDSQDYDLVVDMNGFKKIQVKTTYYKQSSGRFAIELRTKTHSMGKFYSQKTVSNDIDFLFIVTDDNTKYLIPRKLIKTKTSLTLSEKYSSFIL